MVQDKSGFPSQAKVPKEPKNIKVVRKQVREHPEYATKLSADTRRCFSRNEDLQGGVNYNPNLFVRELWRHLYAGAPCPTPTPHSGDAPAPSKWTRKFVF
jgi:hypothetical protein